MTPTTGCKSIVWFSWQPTPYNDVLFRALAEDDGLCLHVRFRERVLSSHPWKTPLGTGYSHDYYWCTLGIDWWTIFLIFVRKVDCFVVAGWDHATTIFLLTILRCLGRRYVIWTDTPVLVASAPVRLRRYLRGGWLRWILRGAAAACSTGELGEARLRAMGAPSGRTLNLPFVLDHTEYPCWSQLQCKYYSLEIIRFVSSGRLSVAIKGHDLAIRALACSLGTGSDWEYVIAGSGPDQSCLEKLANSLGVQNNVVFLGWVEPTDLIRLLSDSHVLIHPSPTHDPYPNAVLEGMAAGCVVMASDVSGSALDRINSGMNGLLHRAGDWEHLAEQIRQLRLAGVAIASMAKLARTTSEHWTIEHSLRALREVLSGDNPCAE